MRVSIAASTFMIATLCGLLALLGGVGANPSPIPTNKSIYSDRKRWHWCGPRHETGALVGLDDLLCQKVFQPLFDRELIDVAPSMAGGWAFCVLWVVSST